MNRCISYAEPEQRWHDKPVLGAVKGLGSFALVAVAPFAFIYAAVGHQKEATRDNLTNESAAEDRFVFDFTREGGCLDDSVYANIDEYEDGIMQQEVRDVYATGPDSISVISAGQISLNFLGLQDPSRPLRPADAHTSLVVIDANCNLSQHDGPA